MSQVNVKVMFKEKRILKNGFLMALFGGIKCYQEWKKIKKNEAKTRNGM